MVFKTVEEQKRISAETEALAQEYKRSQRYLDAVAAKRKKQGRAPMPSTMKGDIYGTQEQVKDRLIKQYEQGEIPADVSAEIRKSAERPGQYEVHFSETAGFRAGIQQSVIKYYDYQDVEQPVAAGSGRYAYDIDVEHPEQARDVRIWAAAHGHTSERIQGEDDRTSAQLMKLSPEERVEAGLLKVRIYTDQALAPDTAIDIRTVETIQTEQSEKLGRIMGPKIYEEADPLERVGLHVRTLLSPAGYGYVGAVAREQASPIDRVMIDLAFPGISSTKDVVIKDIEKRTARHSRGVYTVNIAGFNIDERIVSAVQNPVTDVLLMALGGAGAAKIGATKIGAKIMTGVPGKLVAAGIGGLYAGERTGKVLTLRASGRSGEALGTAITAVAGVAAGVGAYKAEYSHIMKARAEHLIKIDIKEVKGGSVTKRVGKGTTVSRGKFRITEGKLKGLRGETVSLTGKKGGVQVTKIPAQTVGTGSHKIKVTEQVFRDFTQHGIVSKKLKISWQKAGDWLLQIKGGTGIRAKIVGPRKDTALMQEIARTRARVTFGKKVTGGRVEASKDVVIRKFSGISTGTTARKYDLYLVQKGTKILIAEKSIIASRHLAKIDWVDISPVKTGGTGSGRGVGAPGFRATTGGRGPTTAVKTVSPSLPSPATPRATMNIKIQAPVPKSSSGLVARIVPALNPVPYPVRIKRGSELAEIQIATGTPRIIKQVTREQERPATVLGRVPLVTNVPAIIRGERGKIGEVLIIGAGQLAIPTTHPITGQKVTPKERTTVLATLEPIIDRVPSQPVTPVEVPVMPPPHIIPNLGMIPFLRMGKGKFNIEKMLKGIKTNPVPDIEKVI